jgi:hypothetical protein
MNAKARGPAFISGSGFHTRLDQGFLLPAPMLAIPLGWVAIQPCNCARKAARSQNSLTD